MSGKLFGAMRIVGEPAPWAAVLSQKALNVVLLVIIAGCLWYALAVSFGTPQNFRLTPDDKSRLESFAALSQPVPSKPLSYYQNLVQGRDIFRFNARSNAVTVAPVEPVEDQQVTEEITRNLFLVGIMIDNNPTAIIRNGQSNETYFLHVGEVAGNFVIKDIMEEKVLLQIGSQVVELKR